MATPKQKQSALNNLEKAREVRSSSARAVSRPHGKGPGPLSMAARNALSSSQFAFANERKKPLSDASHVRNAVARFDQVDGVSGAARTKAWERIKAAARKLGMEIDADHWRYLQATNKANK
ncbi:MAG: DUF6582 domain-containing protein [Acidimicrobiales bacterium]